MSEAIDASSIMSMLRKRLDTVDVTVDSRETSEVTQVGDGIAYVAGLRTAMAGDLLQCTSASSCEGGYGIAQTLAEGIALAGEMIDSGRALAKLEEFVAFTNEME